MGKQIEYEKTQALIADGDRALELIGRAIRMAGYSNLKKSQSQKSDSNNVITLEKKTGYHYSDALYVKQGLSDGIDFDCIGNVFTQDRTRGGLAQQGFKVEHQAGVAKGSKVNGGSLICQSLDRQGRLQTSMLMNGIEQLVIDELPNPQGSRSGGQKLYRVRLQMTDGQRLQVDLERTFATRNL